MTRIPIGSIGSYTTCNAAAAQKSSCNIDNTDNKKYKPSVPDEIKAVVPGAVIDVRETSNLMTSSLNDYAARCESLGIDKNVTVSPRVLDKMEKDPDFKNKVLRNLKSEFGQTFPNIPGMKLLTHGAVINEDGSVGGWAVGGPDGTESSHKEKHCFRTKKHRELDYTLLQEAAVRRNGLATLDSGNANAANLSIAISAYEKS